MFEWFKKKVVSKVPKKTVVRKYRDIQVDVGISRIRIELEDGSIIHKNIEGHVGQFCSSREVETICKVSITSSVTEAGSWMSSLSNYGYALFDQDNDKVAYYSKPKKAEIIETKSHMVNFSETYLVEK